MSRRLPLVRGAWPGYVAALAAVAAVSGFIGLVHGYLRIANISMLYLIAVLAVAMALEQVALAKTVVVLAFAITFGGVVLAIAIAQGCPYEQAAALANVAGGLEVERQGMVPIAKAEIVEELRRMIGPRGGKVLQREALLAETRRRRGRGDTIVFTNGCFDLLHMGHVKYLQQARQLGSCLIVAINSDKSVQRLKGPRRPVIGQDERAAMLGSLECVDYVTIFEEDTPIGLLEMLRPDILVKGGTTPVVVGREVVEGYGGQVRTMDMVAGLSTTQIIDRIVGADGKPGTLP